MSRSCFIKANRNALHFAQKGPLGGNGSKQAWRQGSHGKLQECRGCAAVYGAEDELLGLERCKLHVKRDAVANIKEKAAPAHDRPVPNHCYLLHLGRFGIMLSRFWVQYRISSG